MRTVCFAICAFVSAASAQSICIARHPIYLEGRVEVDYTAGCTGHDEPELFPISSKPGSARELTWTAVLPGSRAGLVSAVGPAFWFGGVVTDPHSLLGQAFVELQFYPDAIVKNCFPNGAYSLQSAADAYTVCAPVWSVTQAGPKFKEPAASNNMLLDSATPQSPLIMHAGDTITVHWFTTAAQDGFHVTVTDLNTKHSGTIVLNSSHGPLMPAYDTQTVGNSLAWGAVNDAPNSFVWEIGHTSNFASPPGQFCVPGQTFCDSYNAASWSAIAPIQIVSVTFGDGSAPEQWGVVSDQGGIAEVNANCATYGGPFCIYPWYTSNTKGIFHYGIDYPDTKKNYGDASQFTQTTQCGGAFGANTTYCSTILK